LIVTGVLNGVVPASGVGVIWPGLTRVVAALFVAIGSSVSLPAAVTIVTGAALIGVNVVVQVIVAPTANGLAAAVQFVVAPAGAPPGKVTTQVAFTAGFGPAFWHVEVTVTCVPIVADTLVGAEACMSASAVGTEAQVAFAAGHVVGGAVHTAPLSEQPLGGLVVSCVATLNIFIVPAASELAVVNVSFNTCGVPATIGSVTVIVQSMPAAAGRAQFVVPFAIAVNVVCCGTTSKNVYPAACVVPAAVFVTVRSNTAS